MYKDFKQSGSLDTGLVGGNGIIWMFSGVILGLLVGLGMYYFANNKAPSLSSVDSVQKKIETAQAQKKHAIPGQLVQHRNKHLSNSQQPKRNNFSYYAVLPNLDVPVGSTKPVKTVLKNHKLDGVDESTAKKVALLEADDVQTETLSANKEGFMIQVASFKHKNSANKAIKRLSKKGVKAFIQPKKVKGRTWYRVVAGPINADSIDGWKLAAEKLGHRPMVISVR